MVSIFAFTSDILIDGVSVPMGESGRKIRPVMSKGQVIAPVAFFEKGLGAKAEISGEKIALLMNGRTLRMTEGSAEYEVGGGKGEFTVAPRKEKEYLCLPAAECLKALGVSARQFGQMVVAADEKTLDMLAKDETSRRKLARSTCGIYNASRFTSEDFRKGRDAWRRELCGDTKTNDLSIPGMKNLLEMRDQDSEMLRKELHRELDAVILFGDCAPKESMDLQLQYDRIVRMAQPYGTIGCRGYKSEELAKDVIYALDWMHDNMYGANVLSDESYRSYKDYDWWHWYVGGPCPMMDAVMIIEDALTKEQINKYLLPMSFIRTQMRVDLGPEMGMSRILPLTPLALLTEDRALLQAIYEDEVILLEEHDTGSCMRRDWCCMSHALPYNIMYGQNYLSRVGRLLQVLGDTPLAFPIQTSYNLMHMARYTFAPVIYQGRGMSMMNGRGMQNASVSAALSVLKVIRFLYGLFGEEEDREISEIIYRNSTPDVRTGLISTYDTGVELEAYRKLNVGGLGHKQAPKTHIASYGAYCDALTNPKYDSGDYQLGYMWYSGDCCVQFRHGRMSALRMNSSREHGYESINQANQDGWYTGDGMLYLYTPDAPEQYDEAWWKGVDKYLMPGTTVEDRLREARSIRYGLWYKSSKDFVGGVDLEKQFVTASMDLESFHNDVDLHLLDDGGYGVSHEVFDCTLTAMKSWFMFDKAIVALGAEVNAQDNYAVRTVVENKLLTNSVEGILINGQQIPSDFTEETRTDVERIYLPGTGGFIFPMGGKVTMRVYQKEDTPFFACWLEHGDNPRGEKYAYIVLPDASAEETAAYDAGNIEILANDGKIQSAREKASGLTGIVFREACEFAGVEAKQAMIVMMKEENGTISLSACDPTQKKETFEFVVQGAKEIVSCHERMTAEKMENGVKLTVSCDSSRGRGYGAVLEMQ